MRAHIAREQEVHGARWERVHDGYFSDPAVAAPLVRSIRQAARASKPDTIVDLGGGTGALLSLLRAAGAAPGASMINLDDSPRQLRAARSRRFSCLRRSVDSFSRRDLGPEAGRCLFVMRSVLHYFGCAGLRRVLRHLRAQARPGEFFVHQTASFRRRRDAEVLNALYRMMRTSKWYPTAAVLRKALRAAGWKVLEVRPAPPLRLNERDMAERYRLSSADVRRIRDRLSRLPRVPRNVFRATPGGFRALLHYHIYVCAPAARQAP